MTVGGVFQHQRAVDSSKRIFILTRSAFAGQQRYGANTWSGDVTSSWTALRNQISAGLNFSLDRYSLLEQLILVDSFLHDFAEN